jgi:hypothetical protein
MVACLKGGVYLRIHVDGEVLLLHDLIVPLRDLAIHPLLEEVADNRVDNVGEISSRQLVNFSRLQWEALSNRWPVASVV